MLRVCRGDAMLAQVQLESYLASVSQHSTNHIVQILTSGIEFDSEKNSCDIHNAHMTLALPTSYCELAFSHTTPNITELILVGLTLDLSFQHNRKTCTKVLRLKTCF